MIRHNFPSGDVSMAPLALNLGAVEPEAALKAIDIAREDAHTVYYDFRRDLDDAETIIRNTGSIFGNARPVHVDITGSRTLCTTCTGSGIFPVYSYDVDQFVYQTCPDCGGSCMSGPVILPGE